MKIDYQCDKCERISSNGIMESFLCSCGGNMRLKSNLPRTSVPFNAGWCDTLKCEVTSWKDQERKAANHRSRSHPQGFTMIQDNKKWVAELKNIRRHKEDYKRAVHNGQITNS